MVVLGFQRCVQRRGCRSCGINAYYLVQGRVKVDRAVVDAHLMPKSMVWMLMICSFWYRLVELSDVETFLTYEVVAAEDPLLVSGAIHTIRLRRITDDNTTFVEWTTVCISYPRL